MSHYHVDLRSFPADEREHLYEILKGSSFMCNPFIDRNLIGVYDVFWESSEPIETVLKISTKYIIPQH